MVAFLGENGEGEPESKDEIIEMQYDAKTK
jgi:hypothetical protein